MDGKIELRLLNDLEMVDISLQSLLWLEIPGRRRGAFVSYARPKMLKIYLNLLKLF
jgi:hypothetical protein